MRKIILFLIISTAVLIIAGCGSGPDRVNHLERIPVKMGRVETKEIAIPVHTSGRLYPQEEIRLSFKTGGVIGSLTVGEGVRVEKGQVLASLNLAEVDARVNQAENAVAKAERDRERVENLYRDRAATLEQVQNVRTALDVARSDLSIARFNREYSIIRAPSRGKILRKLAEVNEMVAPGYPVFVFGSTRKNWVIKAGISDTDVVKISLNDRVRVRFDAYPKRFFSGRVSEISQAVDPASGTYEIEAELPDEGVKLVTGFIGSMDIFPAQKSVYSLISVDALVDSEGDQAYVFSVAGDRAVRHRIRISHLFKDRVAVESGLENIKDIVVSGAPYLEDGSPVTILR